LHAESVQPPRGLQPKHDCGDREKSHDRNQSGNQSSWRSRRIFELSRENLLLTPVLDRRQHQRYDSNDNQNHRKVARPDYLNLHKFMFPAPLYLKELYIEKPNVIKDEEVLTQAIRVLS
jgi:hypothetical protein